MRVQRCQELSGAKSDSGLCAHSKTQNAEVVEEIDRCKDERRDKSRESEVVKFDRARDVFHKTIGRKFRALSPSPSLSAKLKDGGRGGEGSGTDLV